MRGRTFKKSLIIDEMQNASINPDEDVLTRQKEADDSNGDIEQSDSNRFERLFRK